MATRFKLDGASSLSTEDINLLDADTAHTLQSDGFWSNKSISATNSLETITPPSKTSDCGE